MLAVIVDDNKQAAQDLSERLGDFDEVEIGGIALNGMDGLALVGQVQPDVLFLDVQLPDLSGLDFLEKMSSQTHGKCRVVMYTAYDEYILPAFRKKAFDVLLKPIEDAELATIMHRLTHEDVFVLHPDENNNLRKLIDKRDIGLFQYNHEQRCWEVVVAGSKKTIRLKRNLKSEALLDLSDQFVQINQKFIINMDYLIEVVDNVCHFYPPFDAIDYVKVSRVYRRKLIDHFHSL